MEDSGGFVRIWTMQKRNGDENVSNILEVKLALEFEVKKFTVFVLI